MRHASFVPSSDQMIPAASTSPQKKSRQHPSRSVYDAIRRTRGWVEWPILLSTSRNVNAIMTLYDFVLDRCGVSVVVACRPPLLQQSSGDGDGGLQPSCVRTAELSIRAADRRSTSSSLPRHRPVIRSSRAIGSRIARLRMSRAISLTRSTVERSCPSLTRNVFPRACWSVAHAISTSVRLQRTRDCVRCRPHRTAAARRFE